jgi:NAD(P)-dependent dehydrogenase (short-subunit alcohol dehydrogenase family)
VVPHCELAVTVLAVEGKAVRRGISAPAEIAVCREEAWHQLRQQMYSPLRKGYAAHLYSPVVFEDIHFHRRPYDPLLAYAQSKTANVPFAVAATRRRADAGITANALMPGGIMTKLQQHMNNKLMQQFGMADSQGRKLAKPDGWKTPEQGAATSTLLAVSPLLEGIGGRYFEDCAEAEPATGVNPRRGLKDYALDPDAADRLWDESLRMVEDAGEPSPIPEFPSA